MSEITRMQILGVSWQHATSRATICSEGCVRGVNIYNINGVKQVNRCPDWIKGMEIKCANEAHFAFMAV